MASLSFKPKVALQLQPVPKAFLYPAIGGEMLKNLGMQDGEQIRAIQQAIAEGLIQKVTVAAKHRDTGRTELFHLDLKSFSQEDVVEIEMSQGKSFCEALDTGLAATLHYAASLIKRRNLVPSFHITWSDRVSANPALLRDALIRLNLKVTPAAAPVAHPGTGGDEFEDGYVAPPPPQPATAQSRFAQAVNTFKRKPALPAGYEYLSVFSITPGRDPGVTFSHETSRRKR